MVIVFFFDNKYFHFIEPLTKSISLQEPDSKIYCHAFNLTQEQRDELYTYPCVNTIINEKIEFNPEVADEYHKGLNRGQPLRFQLTCRRGGYLLDAMKMYHEEEFFITADVDTLMIKPLTELKEQMKDHDIGFVHVSTTKVASGFIAARQTENAKKYLKTWYDTAMTDRLYLCKDQKTMALVYEQMKNEVNFLKLDRRYLDHACKDESVMWSGHKTAFGTKDEKYQKYLEQNEEDEIMDANSIIHFVKSRIKGKKVLDIGSIGNNEDNPCSKLLRYRKGEASSVIGIDNNWKEVERLNDRVSDLYYMNIEDYYHVEPFVRKHGIFDVVVMTDVIEHIGNLTACLNNIKLLIKDDGELLISTPNLSHPYFRKPGRIEQVAEHNTGHICWFEIFTLTHLLERSGFTVKKHNGGGKTLLVVAETK